MENAIRPSAIGKMNSLFIGNLRTRKRAAILYLPLVYCQRHSEDPLVPPSCAHASVRHQLPFERAHPGPPGSPPRARASLATRP